MFYAFRLKTTAFIGILFTLLLAPLVQAQQQPEYRGMWVDAWNDGFKTAAQIDQLILDAQRANLNVILPQVRRRGDAFYNSDYEPRALGGSFDPLAYLVQKAKAATPPIEIHAWIVSYPMGTASSNSNHILNKHPDWLMKSDTGGNLVPASPNAEYWVDPAHPEVQQHTFDVAMDIVSSYDIDGFHFDYIRYPSRSWGYNPVSVARFNARYNRSGQPSTTDTAWLQFRRDAVTELVRRVYLEAIALKPAIKISAATIGQGNAPSTWTSSTAYAHRLQDWRAWMEEGILDLNMPMLYFNWAETNHRTWWTNWIRFAKDHKYNRHLSIGPAWYWNTVADNLEQIRDTRKPTAAGNQSDGVTGYNYNVTNNQKISRTTFFNALANDVFNQKVSTPAMPWKTSPTRGHVKGYVANANTGEFFDGATVSLSGPQSRTLRTDGNGFFGAVELVPGTYTVTASMPGSHFDSQSRQITVTAGAVASADIDLFVEASAEVVIDNADAVFTGSWTTATDTSQFGTDYARAWPTTNPTPTATATFRPYITIPGTYDLFVWYVEGPNRAPDAPFTLKHSQGEETIRVDQRTGGGAWKLLARDRHFEAGSDGFLQVGNHSDGSVVIADAVGFTLVEADPDPTLFFDEPIAYAGPRGATITWETAGPATAWVEYGLAQNNTALSTETTTVASEHSVRITDLLADRVYHARLHAREGNRTYASSWFTFKTQPDVEVTIDATQPAATFSSGWFVSSDTRGWNTYRYASTVTGSATATATYRPSLPTAGDYDVSLYYLASSNRSTRVPFVISHQQGTTTATVNQQMNDRQWFRIGQDLPFGAGTTGFVRFTNNTGESSLNVIADAIRFSLVQRPIQHSLLTRTEGSGTVTKTPSSAAYAHGASVSLSASAAEGWVFSHWTGDAQGAANPLSMTLYRDREATAVFSKLYEINVTIDGGGTVRSSPDQNQYADGTTVELRAVADEGWEFTGWSGDVPDPENPLNILVDGDKNIVAKFEQPTGAYESWRAQNFSQEEQADPSISGPDADPYGHGIPNLLKYAFALDPQQPDLARMPRAQMFSGKLRLVFNRLSDAPDIEYIIEASDDLTNWEPAASDFNEVSVQDNNDGRSETVIIESTSQSNGERRFIRVRVNQL